MDGLAYMIADRMFGTVDDAMLFYDRDKHAPVCSVLYRGVQVGTIDIDRLSAEFTRNRVMAGHP